MPTDLAAAFYLPRSRGPANLGRLVSDAGVQDVQAGGDAWPDTSGAVHGTWAGMRVRGWVERLDEHDCLVLWFSRTAAHPALDHAGSEPDRQLSETFVKAARTLGAVTAFVAVHPDQAELRSLRDAEWMVTSRAADALADQRYGLLWLAPSVAAWWTPHPLRDDREEIPVGEARAVFAGTGHQHWY